jgi:hypothetical protein
MRTTTELTVRFNLNLNLIGSAEIEEALDGLGWRLSEDEFEYDPLESLGADVVEALNTEELNRLERECELDDALDFDLVPFEQVEADLAMELYEQDLAEERESMDYRCYCAKCAREETWDDELVKVAGVYLCKLCKPAPILEQMYAYLAEHRHDRDFERRLAQAKKWRAALKRAKELRPDLNWARFDMDPRMFV